MENEKHIKIKMKPEIIVKASPTFEPIDAKAVAGVSADDIIERNVIAQYEAPEEGDESDAGAGLD